MRRAVVYLLWRELRWRIAIVAVVLAFITADAVYAHWYWQSLSWDRYARDVAPSRALMSFTNYIDIHAPLERLILSYPEVGEEEKVYLLPMVTKEYGLVLLLVCLLLGIHPYGVQSSGVAFLASRPRLEEHLLRARFCTGVGVVLLPWLYLMIIYRMMFPTSLVAEISPSFVTGALAQYFLVYTLAVLWLMLWGMLLFLGAYYISATWQQLSRGLFLLLSPFVLELIFQMVVSRPILFRPLFRGLVNRAVHGFGAETAQQISNWYGEGYPVMLSIVWVSLLLYWTGRKREKEGETL